MTSSFEKLKVPFYLSWPFVILALVIFWPLGLILLIARLARDRHASISTGRILKLIGIPLTLAGGIIFVLGIWAELTKDPLPENVVDDGHLALTLVAVVFLLGVVLWKYGSKLQTRGRMVRQYLELVVNQRISDISVLSARTGKDETQVTGDLAFLIDKEFLPNAHIDGQQNRVIIPSVQKQVEFERRLAERRGQGDTPDEGKSSNENETKDPIPVRCPSCGATNLVEPGGRAECEFCGSPLKRGSSR